MIEFVGEVTNITRKVTDKAEIVEVKIVTTNTSVWNKILGYYKGDVKVALVPSQGELRLEEE